MKNSLLSAFLLVCTGINFLTNGIISHKPAVEQSFLTISYGSKSAKLTGNDVNGALSHSKQLGVSASHFGSSLLIVVSVVPYKLGQTGAFTIKYPTDGTTLAIMEDGQPLMVTSGKITISSATQSHVTGSFSGKTMDNKTVSGTFSSKVLTSESARKGG